MGICSDNISRTCKAIAFWVLHCHGTEDINYLELQSTAGELSRECHRVAALRTTWLRYKSRAGTCNATPGIFASKVCLPSGTPVADSADLIANDLKVVDEAAAPRTSRVGSGGETTMVQEAIQTIKELYDVMHGNATRLVTQM
mmetsp:Transcript_66523/g.107974  ORF Transcript_66523/g.107974 Transcript_66523/m.107974 type:complete len:143 (+) Transcript_66523:3340-3768(+)